MLILVLINAQVCDRSVWVSVCSVCAVTTFSLVVITAVLEEYAASIFMHSSVHRVGTCSQTIVTRLRHECSLPQTMQYYGTCYPVMKEDPLIL